MMMVNNWQSCRGVSEVNEGGIELLILLLLLHLR